MRKILNINGKQVRVTEKDIMIHTLQVNVHNLVSQKKKWINLYYESMVKYNKLKKTVVKVFKRNKQLKEDLHNSKEYIGELTGLYIKKCKDKDFTIEVLRKRVSMLDGMLDKAYEEIKEPKKNSECKLESLECNSCKNYKQEYIPKGW